MNGSLDKHDISIYHRPNLGKVFKTFFPADQSFILAFFNMGPMNGPTPRAMEMLENLERALYSQTETPHVYVFPEMESLLEGFLSDRYVHKIVRRKSSKSGGISCYILKEIYATTDLMCVESDYISALTFDVKIRGRLLRISGVYVPPGPQILLNSSNIVIKSLVRFSKGYDTLFLGDFNLGKELDMTIGRLAESSLLYKVGNCPASLDILNEIEKDAMFSNIKDLKAVRTDMNCPGSVGHRLITLHGKKYTRQTRVFCAKRNLSLSEAYILLLQA